MLDDYEGRVAAAPAMRQLRELADVTVWDRPLAPEDPAGLTDVRVLLSIRERTRLDGDLFDQFPNLELVLQTGGHAYDEPTVERLPLDELLPVSDVISIHLRLSPESRGLLDRARLARVRHGALLINTARGAIVDEDALVEALRDGRLGGAGLPSVAEQLPPPSVAVTSPPFVARS